MERIHNHGEKVFERYLRCFGLFITFLPPRFHGISFYVSGKISEKFEFENLTPLLCWMHISMDSSQLKLDFTRKTFLPICFRTLKGQNLNY